MFTYPYKPSPCGSTSGSEPTTPDLSPSILSASSTQSLCSMPHRRRFVISSSPSPPGMTKKRPMRDVLLERMGPLAPSVLILFLGLLFIFHFITGFVTTTPMGLELTPMKSLMPDAKPSHMSNVDVVSELQRWKNPPYAQARLKVFYYDLPEEFNSELVSQSHSNPPKIRDPFCDENFYSAENRIANFFKDGYVRTRDASEADFFYVPIYTTCYLITNLPNDVNKTGRFFERAMDTVVHDYPYWNRSDGRDHVFMFAQGFGARLAGDWQKYRHATFLVHNGDYDEAHFDTHKDIVVPPDLSHYFVPVGQKSPGKLLEKSNFVLFGGQVLNSSISDHRGSNYSGGVRQFVQADLSKVEGYKITGVRSNSYIEDMMHSVFCLAPHGWHKWSPRPAYAILLGCIPVVISEKQQLFLEHIINYDAISYWVRPEDIRGLDGKLRALSPRELMEKERALRDVWRLLWYGEEGLAEQAIMYSLYRKLGTSKPHRLYI